MSGSGMFLFSSPAATAVPATPARGTRRLCELCEHPCMTPQATLCPRCMRLRDRYSTGKPARTEALRRGWSRERGGFVCTYSGVLLTDDPASPWYLSYDYRPPRDETNLVLCAQLVNHMKSNLTAPEFTRIVVQLADVMTGKRERIEVFTPTFWGQSVKPYRRA